MQTFVDLYENILNQSVGNLKIRFRDFIYFSWDDIFPFAVSVKDIINEKGTMFSMLC